MATYLNQVLSGVETVHLLQANTFVEALQALIDLDARAVSFTIQKEYRVNNIGVLEVRDGQFIFEVPINYEVDLCSNFVSNVPIEVYVGIELVPSTETVVLTNSVYSSKKVVFVLPPQNVPNSIFLSYKATLLDPELREAVSSIETLISGSLIYSNGTVRRV